MIADCLLVFEHELAEWEARAPLTIEQRYQRRLLKKLIKFAKRYLLGEQLDDRFDTEGNER